MPEWPPLSQLLAGGALGLWKIGLDSLGRLAVFTPTGIVPLLFTDTSGDVTIGVSGFQVTSNAAIAIKQGGLSQIANINTLGKGGVPALFGLDNRSGITAADGSPITLYAVPAGANQLFDGAIEIDATAFTSGTATYTLTYTENGVAQTMVVTATVINTVTGVRRLIQADASTNITVQLTGAFVATVRLSSAVMQLA